MRVCDTCICVVAGVTHVSAWPDFGVWLRWDVGTETSGIALLVRYVWTCREGYRCSIFASCYLLKHLDVAMIYRYTIHNTIDFTRV